MTEKPFIVRQPNVQSSSCSNKTLYLVLFTINVIFVVLTVLIISLVIYSNMHHHQEETRFGEYYSNYQDECGVVFESNNLLGRIVGGVPANQDSWPWHAMVVTNYFVSHLQIGAEYLVHNQTYGYKCGATLISRRTLLTAAHCVYNKFYLDVNNETYTFSLQNHDILQGITVYMGDSDLKNNNRENKYSDYFQARVSRILVVSFFLSSFFLLENLLGNTQFLILNK